MSTRGTQLTLLVAAVIALALPKWTPCTYPDEICARPPGAGAGCRGGEVEPLGFYLIELVAHRDVGFAYSAGDDCR